MANRPPEFERIDEVLAAARARLRRRALLHALLVGVAALGGAFLVFVALAGAFQAGRTLRLITWLALGGGAGALLWRLLLRPWRRWSAPAQVAAHLERRVPELRDALLSIVQFAREWGRPGEQSPALVGVLAGQVASRLQAVDVAAETPLLPTRRPLAAALAVVAIWGGLLALGPTWLDRGLGTLLPAHTADGARFVGPLVGDLEVLLVYPPYMKRPDRSIPNSTGDFEAPKGTEVHLKATTHAPARSLALRFGTEGGAGDPREVPMALRDARDGLVTFAVTEAGTWRFVVVTEDGETQVEAIDRHVRLEPDAPPSVTLALPAADQEITDLRPLRVEFTASDDYGLSKAAVLLTLAADADHPERIEQPGVSGRRLEGGEEVDLSRIQAAAGDRIGLSVEVYDDNAVDGPQRAVSNTIYLTIHSPQRKHQELMERLNALVDQLVEVLADRLEIDYRAAGPTPVPDQVSGYLAATDAAAKAFSELVEALKEDALTPRQVLLALAGRLGELEKALGVEKPVVALNLRALAAPGADNAIRAVSRANEATVDKVEQSIVLLEAMVARLAIEELMALTDEIKASTERLRGLIQEYKQAPSEALKQRIRRDIQRLKARIQEIRERMAKLRQKLPEEFLNLDGLKDNKVNEGLDKTQEQLDALDKMVDEGRLDDALKAIEDMEKALEELSSQLNDDLEEVNDQSNPEMQKAISELMDQTRDLMKQQQALNLKTAEALKEHEDCLKALLEKDLKAPYAALKERGGKLRQMVELIDPRDLPSYMGDDVDHARQRVDDFGVALERPDFGDALEMAERAVDMLENIDRSSRYADVPPSAATRKALAEGRATARELARDTAALLRQYDQLKRQKCEHLQKPMPQEMAGEPPPMPTPQLGEGQPQPAPQRPGDKQRQVGEGARRLQQRIGERQAQMPGLPQGAPEHAQKAAEAMDRAAEGLDRQRPAEAQPGQQQAMNELQSIMDGLHEAASPQRAEREGENREGHRGADRRRVEIPGADAHEAPAEFRKDLLDAMKDKPPEEFQEQVKRYYQSLVE